VLRQSINCSLRAAGTFHPTGRGRLSWAASTRKSRCPALSPVPYAARSGTPSARMTDYASNADGRSGRKRLKPAALPPSTDGDTGLRLMGERGSQIPGGRVAPDAGGLRPPVPPDHHDYISRFLNREKAGPCWTLPLMSTPDFLPRIFSAASIRTRAAEVTGEDPGPLWGCPLIDKYVVKEGIDESYRLRLSRTIGEEALHLYALLD